MYCYIRISYSIRNCRQFARYHILTITKKRFTTMKTSLFFLILFCTHSITWSDDVWFTLPMPGQPVSGTLTVKIYPPMEDVPVHMWIEDRMENVVWTATIDSTTEYSIDVDTTRFRPGRYEINAIYFLYGDDFDGDIDIEVNAP